MAENSQRGGFVFYPREYHIDGTDPAKSYVRGARYDGSEAIVYLKPSYQAVSNAHESSSVTVPSLSRFAETHRKAKTPCRGVGDNKRGGEGGALLVEQVKLHSAESRDFGGRPVYHAKWASVLREDADMPHPAIGFGYLETALPAAMDQSSKNIQQAIEAIRAKIRAGDASPELHMQGQCLLADQMDGMRKWFTAVVLDPKETQYVESASKQRLKDQLLDVLAPRTQHGRYGMALLRVRRGAAVLTDFSAQIKMDYDYGAKCIKPYDEVFDEFMRLAGGDKVLSVCTRDPSLELDIIPAQRINCRGSDGHYASQLMVRENGGARPGKVLKTYVDKEFHDDFSINFDRRKAFLYSKIAVRIAETNGPERNQLLSSIHSFSEPLGNAYSIGPKGTPIFEIDRGLDDHPRILAAASRGHSEGP